MKEKIKKNKDIIDNLKKTEESLGKAQKDLGTYQKKIAYSEKGVNLVKDLLIDIDEKIEIFPTIKDSLRLYSKILCKKSEQLSENILDSNIKDIIVEVSGLTETTSATALSGTAVGFFAEILPKSYFKVQEFVEQTNQVDEIYKRLDFIPSLALEYKETWDAFPISTTKGSLLSMREVVRNLYDYLAPNDKVKEFCYLNKIKLDQDKYGNEIITRPNKTQYLASKIKNTEKRKLFLNERKSYKCIYDLLCSAHENGKISPEKARSAMYQADDLIKRTLDLASEISGNGQ